MVVPIGISFGDLVALGSLVRKASAALSESRGASSDFQSLGRWLSSLSSALCGIHYIIGSETKSQPPFSVSTMKDRSMQNAFQFQFSACQEILEEIFIMMQPFAEILSTSSTTRGLGKAKKQIFWTLAKRNEVVKKISMLDRHVKAFELYMHAALGQTRFSGPEHQTRREKAPGFLSDVPNELGYPWSADLLIEDGLGEKFALPLDLCRTPEVICRLLILS